MKENFIKLSHELVFVLVALAAIAAALFFLPNTFEFFEFNKFTALLVITAASLLIWATRMVLQKKVILTRTPLDIPLLVFLGVFFVASVASIDQFTSLVGAHGRFWPGFFPLAVAGVLYFCTAANLNSKKHVTLILWVLVAGTTVASLVAIASYFGLYLPFEFAKIRSFNPVGSITRLAVLLAFVIPISTAWTIFEKDKVTRTVATIATLIMVFSLILVNFVPSYIGLLAAFAVIALGTLRTKLDKSAQGSLAVLAVFTVLFLILRFVPQVAQGTLYAWIVSKDTGLSTQEQIDTPKERPLPIRSAWDVAAQAIGKRPLFGTGPGTFQFVYTQLKPRYVNLTDDWPVRFDKSNSDFTEIVATTGIFGTLAYLLLVVTVARLVWTLISRSEKVMVYLPLSAAIIGYLVGGFFTLSSLATTTAFLVGLALLSTLAKINNEPHVWEVTVEVAALKSRFGWLPLATPKRPPLVKTEVGARGTKSQVLPSVFALACVLFSIWALYYQVNAYRAEYYLRQALVAARANDGGRTINFLQRAIGANPRVDTYHQQLSQTSLSAATNLSSRGNLSDNEKQLLAQLAQVAIDQGKVASGYQILPLRLPGISATDVTNWETLSSVYQALIGSVGGADVHATNTLAQAVALDPENPLLHHQLGQLYLRLNNLDLAQRKFEDATVVKGDWGPAHYSLAKLLIERKGEVARIVNELTLAKRFLPPNDPALGDIDQNLATYNKQLQELQKQQGQGTTAPAGGPSLSPSPPVRQPSPSPSPSPSPTGEPSPSPSL